MGATKLDDTKDKGAENSRKVTRRPMQGKLGTSRQTGNLKEAQKRRSYASTLEKTAGKSWSNRYGLGGQGDSAREGTVGVWLKVCRSTRKGCRDQRTHICRGGGVSRVSWVRQNKMPLYRGRRMKGGADKKDKQSMGNNQMLEEKGKGKKDGGVSGGTVSSEEHCARDLTQS